MEKDTENAPSVTDVEVTKAGTPQIDVTVRKVSPSASDRLVISLPEDATVKDLIAKLVEKTALAESEFWVEDLQQRLPDLGARVKELPFFGKRPLFMVLPKNVPHNVLATNPSRTSISDSDRAQSLFQRGTPSIQRGSHILPLAKREYSPHAAIKRTEYVGLSNQGATCYLNSLLQTQFMTPEFRLAVYQWSFDDWVKADYERAKNLRKEGSAEPVDEEEQFQKYKNKAESVSIARCLQKLFLNLQTNEAHAVTTQELTKSFSWDKRDSFIQHDVQELLRVLLEALESVWKGTDKASLIDDLYQGYMKDYVRCNICGYESSRTDSFLDIQLVIKGFGETEAVGSLEEAFEKFVEVETLDIENAWRCEKCQKPVRALKGLEFTKFPYILPIQLKRFTFDMVSMREIKLNDRVTFPEILNLNKFCPEQKEEDEVEETEEKKEVKEPKEPVDDEAKAEASANVEEGGASMAETDDEEQEQVSVPSPRSREDVIAEALKDGPAVYELFSVLVHNGTSRGGHYSAFVKSLHKNKWFWFNDSSVKEVDWAKITDTFGSSVDRGTNAYMMFYRRYDPEVNQQELSTAELPENVQKTISDWKEAKLEKKRLEEEAKSLQEVTLHYLDQTLEVKLHQKTKNSDLLARAVELFDLGDTPREDIRLREWDYHRKMVRPITGVELASPMKTKHYGAIHFAIEVKDSGTKFSVFDPDAKDFNLIIWTPNKDNERINSKSYSWVPQEFATRRNYKVSDVKDIIHKQALAPHIAREDMVLVLSNQTRIMLDHKRVDNYPIYNSSRFYLEPRRPVSPEAPTAPVVEYDDVELNNSEDSEEQEKLKWKSPRAFKELYRIENSIDLCFEVPDSKPVTTHLVEVLKDSSVLSLRALIADRIGLEDGTFRIFSSQRMSSATEIKDEGQSLQQEHIRKGQQIFIKKGKPLAVNENILEFFYFDPLHVDDSIALKGLDGPSDGKRVVSAKEAEKKLSEGAGEDVEEKGPVEGEEMVVSDTPEKAVTFLFSLRIKVDQTVAELKEVLAKHFAGLQMNPATKRKDQLTLPTPANMRLRVMQTYMPPSCPRNVLIDSDTVSKALAGVEACPSIGIQALPNNSSEEKVSPDQQVVFLQKWNPVKFCLERRFEFTVDDTETIGSFRDRLRARPGIPEKIAMALALASWNCSKLDFISDTNWQTPADTTKPKTIEREIIDEADGPSSSPSDEEAAAEITPADNDSDNGDEANDGPMVPTSLFDEPDRNYYDDHDNTYSLTALVSSLRLNDGDLLFFKDATIPERELTAEERKRLVALERSRQNLHHRGSYQSSMGTPSANSARSPDLKIQQQTIDIDDL